MRSFRLMALLAMCLMLLAAPVQAKTTITFWHGMGGELGSRNSTRLRTNTKSRASTRATMTKP